MSANPYSDNDQANLHASPIRSAGLSSDGYVKQVPLLGFLHLIQSVFELSMSLLIIVFSGFMISSQSLPQIQQKMWNGLSPQVIGIGYGVLGGVIGLVAILRLTAGILLLKRRGRLIALSASIAGLASVLTCYCAPTSFALSIYSLVVLIQPSVMDEFKQSRG